ncbi:MAG: hypothetical protein KA185_06350 [Vitreoscilla sp.]|nr:hypothetical protein [Vitreoscilla sp.]
MTKAFVAATQALQQHCRRFDASGLEAKSAALAQVAAAPLPLSAALIGHHEALLFLRAHPSSAAMLRQVEAELARLTRFLQAHRGQHPEALQNHGLPFVATATRYSHDCLRWLLQHPHCRVGFHAWGDPVLDLNAVLRLTLPPLERSYTTAGQGNDDLLESLQVSELQRLPFLVSELSRLDATPFVKDQLFDALDLYVRLEPKRKQFSKAYNRLPMAASFFQTELLRQYEPKAVMNQPLPAPRALDHAGLAEVSQVIRNTLALTARETDPGTYMDLRALQVLDLERGLSVALYGMRPERQMPLESYVGFMLFKNGLAVSYGGAWVLGPRANFGMNIFEPYRGGESGYMMCQVLRAYRQTFGVDFFEVDAHQFGLDNADGIASGAFWFYHRHGFRPLDAELAALAGREAALNQRKPGRRSSERTLLKFTGSNVALNFGGVVPPSVDELCMAVTAWVARHHQGDRVAAERDALQRLATASGAVGSAPAAEQRALSEVALLAQALQVSDMAQWQLLRRMARAKPQDLAAYQRLLLQWFALRSKS